MHNFYISSLTTVALFSRSSNISCVANITIFPKNLASLFSAKPLLVLVLLGVFSSTALAVKTAPTAILPSKLITTNHTRDEYQVSQSPKQK